VEGKRRLRIWLLDDVADCVDLSEKLVILPRRRIWMTADRLNRRLWHLLSMLIPALNGSFPTIDARGVVDLLHHLPRG
jgi:hypothetical protein